MLYSTIDACTSSGRLAQQWALDAHAVLEHTELLSTSDSTSGGRGLGCGRGCGSASPCSCCITPNSSGTGDARRWTVTALYFVPSQHSRERGGMGLLEDTRPRGLLEESLETWRASGETVVKPSMYTQCKRVSSQCALEQQE